MSTLSFPVEERSEAPATLQGALLATVVLAFAVLFLAPTRLFFSPFPYDGDYLTFTPPNFIDLIFVAVGVALYARSGRLSLRPLLILLGTMVLGIVFVFTTDIPVVPEQVFDVVLFNLRMVGGFTLGWLLIRARIAPDLLSLLLFGGSLMMAGSTVFLLSSGGGSYEFYQDLGRVGGMGLGPNEASLVFAAALNMLPLLYVRRPWIAFTMPILIAGLIGSGSRTGVLLALAGVWLWVPALIQASRVRKPAVAWLTAIWVAVITWWLTDEMLGSTLFSGLLSPLGLRLSKANDESTLGRFDIWLTVPVLLWENPRLLLLGTGASNVGVERFLKEFAGLWTLHTHDLTMQLVVAYGVAGLVINYLLVRALFRRKRWFPDDASLGLRWFGLTLVGGQLIQCGLYAQKFLLLFTMVLGMVAACSRPQQRLAHD